MSNFKAGDIVKVSNPESSYYGAILKVGENSDHDVVVRVYVHKAFSDTCGTQFAKGEDFDLEYVSDLTLVSSVDGTPIKYDEIKIGDKIRSTFSAVDGEETTVTGVVSHFTGFGLTACTKNGTLLAGFTGDATYVLLERKEPKPLEKEPRMSTEANALAVQEKLSEASEHLSKALTSLKRSTDLLVNEKYEALVTDTTRLIDDLSGSIRVIRTSTVSESYRWAEYAAARGRTQA